MKNQEIIKGIVSRVLKVEEKSISDDIDLYELENYDSLHSLIMLSEIEKFFNVKVPEEDLFDLSTINDWSDELDKLKGRYL